MNSSNGYTMARWVGTAIGILGMLAAGLGAFFTLRADVQNLQKVADTHVTREVVNLQYQAIQRELQAIRESLNRQ